MLWFAQHGSHGSEGAGSSPITFTTVALGIAFVAFAVWVWLDWRKRRRELEP